MYTSRDAWSVHWDCHPVPSVCLFAARSAGSEGSSVVRASDSWSKVPGSGPRRIGERIFCSTFNFLCWLFFRCPFRNTPVIPQWHVKDPGHSAKSAGGRLQLNTHAPYLCGFEGGDTKLVHGWMVYTELAPRRQQFHAAPATQQPNSAISTLRRWILKTRAIKRIQSLIQNHMQHECSESAREQKLALFKSDK